LQRLDGVIASQYHFPFPVFTACDLVYDLREEEVIFVFRVESFEYDFGGFGSEDAADA